MMEYQEKTITKIKRGLNSIIPKIEPTTVILYLTIQITLLSIIS